MSWLSELVHPETSRASRNAASKKAADDAAAVTATNTAETKRISDADAAQARIAALRTSATGAAHTDANRYFSDRGLDPTQYGGAIDDEINNILSTTDTTDPNIGSYLKNIGESVYGGQTDALRSKSLRGVNDLFAPNFETGRIADTADDPYLNQIDAGQRGKADDYITNLLKRHVITDPGATSARSNLDEQGGRVRTQLSSIGSSALAGGRQQLTDVANHARGDAQTLNLGSLFDPNTYGAQADQMTNDFLGGLGDSLSGSVPGNLYDTSGLSAIAGAAQGAGNTNFDPRALAGLNIGEDDPLNSNAKKRTLF